MAVDNNHTLSTGQHDNLTLSTGHHDNVKLPCSENSEAIELVSEVVKNHPSSNEVLSTMNLSSSSAAAFHSIIITNISVSKVDNVVWRGTNDLFCVFELNGWEYHTSVIEEAGDKASWNYIQRINHDDDDDQVKGFMNGSNGGLFMLPFISDITDDLQISSSSHHHQNSINNENHHLHDDNNDDDFIHISNTASSYNKNKNKNVLTIKLYNKNLIVSDKLIGGIDVMLSNYITSELNTTDSIQIIENIYELSSSSSSSSSLLIKQKVKSRGVITMSFLACHHPFNTIYAKSNHQYHSKLHDLIRTNHNYGVVVVVDNKLLSDSSDWKKAESILDFTEQSTSTTTTTTTTTTNNNNNNSSRNKDKRKDTGNNHKQQRKPPIHEGITSCIITSMDDNNGDVNIVVNDDGTSSYPITHINNGNSNVKQSNNKYSHLNNMNNTKNILRNNLKVSNYNNNSTLNNNNNNKNDNNNNVDGNCITTNVGAAAATSILSSSSIQTNLTVISTTITATSKSATAAATALTTTSKKNNVRLPYLYSVLQNVSMIKNNTDLLRSKGNLVYDEAYRLSVKKMSSFIKLTIYEFATILYKLDVPVYHSLVFSSDKLLGQVHYQQQQHHQQQQQQQQQQQYNVDGDDAKTFQLPLTHSMSLAATMSFIIEEHNMIDTSRLKQSYSKTSSSSSSSSSSFSVTNNNQFVLSEELCERALSYMVTLVEGSYSELRGIILTTCEGGEGNDLKNNNINNSLGMMMIHRVGIDDIADDICDVYNLYIYIIYIFIYICE